MADAEWIDNMRKIVLQAVEAGDPCDIVSGTVTKQRRWKYDGGQMHSLLPHSS